MGALRHAPAALPPGKTRYPLYRRLGGPQGRSGRVWKISPLPGFDPRTLSESQRRLSCPSSSIPFINLQIHMCLPNGTIVWWQNEMGVNMKNIKVIHELCCVDHLRVVRHEGLKRYRQHVVPKFNYWEHDKTWSTDSLVRSSTLLPEIFLER